MPMCSSPDRSNRKLGRSGDSRDPTQPRHVTYLCSTPRGLLWESWNRSLVLHREFKNRPRQNLSIPARRSTAYPCHAKES